MVNNVIRLSFLIIFICLIFPEAAKEQKPFNLLLISIDTLRADYVSCFNSSNLKTPNIDFFCQEGIKFTNAFAHNPVTLPSHTNMLTGTTPLFHNIHDNIGFHFNQHNLTLAEHLKKNGYNTAAFIGAFPLDNRFGLSKGFDLYDDYYGEKSSAGIFFFTERPAEEVIKRSINWLSHNQKNLFFLFIHLFDPHQPYIPPAPFKEKYKNNLYAGEVAYVDYSLGKLINYLKTNNLLENTLIILTSDHGESLGEHGENTHGYFAYNSTLHIPLVFYNPILFPKPKTISQPVSHINIFPTICDLLNLKKPNHLQGTSLVETIYSDKEKNEFIYFESLSPYYNRGWAPLQGFIYNNMKFIDSPIPELYNLNNDFKETKNLINEKTYFEYKKQLDSIIRKLSASQTKVSRQIENKETLEILKSLGYLGSTNIEHKSVFTKYDDLKTLLPYHMGMMKALSLFSEGKLQESINLLEKIIKERKDFTTAYAYLANIYHEIGELNLAINTLREGIKTSPRNFDLNAKLGIYLVETDNSIEALNYIKKALEIFDKDAESWNYLGIAYWKLGKYNEAEKAYQKSLEIDQDYPSALNNLGTLYLSENQFALAEKFFKQALKYDPTLSAAYNGLGIVYKSLKKDKEAIENWRKAVELDKYNLLAIYNLGVALAEINEKEEALKYLKRYLEIAPEDEPDRKKVIWIIEAIEGEKMRR